MYKKYNAFLLVFAVFIIAVASACEKDEIKSTETTLLSFGPSGIMHGDTITVIGENLLKVDAFEFTPGIMVTKENFIAHGDTRFRVIVPLDAGPGKIKLHLGDEEIESKTVLNFDVLFSIISFTPEARPGDEITVTGTFLNWIESITFGEGLVVEEFVSQSDGEIVVTVPTEAQTGPLEFQGGGSEPRALETEASFIVTLPAVTSMSPLAIRHADQLTITGTNLDLTERIVFPDGSAFTLPDPAVEVSETTIVLDVPVTAVDGPVTLFAHSGVEVVTAESISVILPQEASLTPAPVPVGEELTITGTNLDLVASLSFPGVSEPVTEFVSQSPTEIKVIVPEGSITGLMKFTTIHGFVVNFTMLLQLPGDGPVPLVHTIFNDDFQNGWGNWGWVGADVPSSEQVFDGTASMKLLFNTGTDAWQGMQLGNGAPLDVSGYSNLVFYLYGNPGSGGSQIMVKINSGDNNPGTTIDVVEGEWVEYSLPISDMNANGGTDNNWGMVILQEFDQLGADVYLDYVGFR